MANVSEALKVHGEVGPRLLGWLAERASGYSRIIEVGSYHGRSAVAMLSNSRAHLTCVDLWNVVTKYGSVGEEDYQLFLKNVEKYADRVTVVRMDSHEAAKLLTGPFDMAFIDGGHDYETVRGDIIAYRELLRPGGLLCGHDYSHRWPGVVRAVREELDEWKLVGSLWWKIV